MALYVRKTVTPLEPVTLSVGEVPPDINEAYRLLREQIGADLAFGAAWKLGGTTRTTRKVFNIDKLYFGPLHESEVMVEPSVAPGRPLFELKGEVEIALRIAPDVADVLKGDPAVIATTPSVTLFDAWCVVLELPSSPIVDLAAAGVAALVADRCASGALLLGPANVFNAASDWTGDKLSTEQDGEVIAIGGVDALVASPDVCARDFLVEALIRGFAPRPGQWISTGGLTPCVPLKIGAKVTVFLNNVAALSFVAGLGRVSANPGEGD
jgi:2-keto-4-pentenoate hydratase